MPGFLSDRNKKRSAKKHHSPTKWSFSPASPKPEVKPQRPELPEVYSDPCDSKPELPEPKSDPVYQSVCKAESRKSSRNRRPLAEKSNFQAELTKKYHKTVSKFFTNSIRAFFVNSRFKFLGSFA